MLLAYISSLLTFFVAYSLSYISTPLRIGPVRFQAGCLKMRLNLALVFFVLILCCRMFCYAHMSGLFVLDLVFICNGLVCIIVFLCGLDHIGFAFSNFVLLGLVFVQYGAERLAAKNVSETIFFVSSGT